MTHQQSIGKSQVHLTPKPIIDALGPFDTDPCAATERPFDCADVNYTESDDGLAQPWRGFVWLNPPYDRRIIGDWMQRLADHGDGIALVHARVETKWFQIAWRNASTILLARDRIKFLDASGTQQEFNSGAPIALIGFGDRALKRLRDSGIRGRLVTAWEHIAPILGWGLVAMLAAAAAIMSGAGGGGA